MIAFAEETVEENGKSIILFGANVNGTVFCFTENRNEAERFIDFLVENSVEENQIFDLIEDFYYT